MKIPTKWNERKVHQLLKSLWGKRCYAEPASNMPNCFEWFSIESISKTFAWGKSNKNRGGSADVPHWGDVSGVPPQFTYVWWKRPCQGAQTLHLLSVKKSKHVQTASPPSHTHAGMSSCKRRKDAQNTCVHVQMHVSIVGLMFTLECASLYACQAWTHLWDFVFVRKEGRRKKGKKWQTGQYPRPSVGTHYELVMVFATHGRLHSLSFPAAQRSIHLFSFSLSPGTAQKKIL